MKSKPTRKKTPPSGDNKKTSSSEDLSADASGKQASVQDVDGLVATPALSEFPIVGVGASAGGLEALEALFANMPIDVGAAFVVMTHQHPKHTSLLPELLANKTCLPVTEAREGTVIEANAIYVAPPGGYLDILSRKLVRMDTECPESPYLPIDHFFLSLAQDQREKAIGIILSGSGTDGTIGMAAIKGASGMTMVQEVDTAKYAGMPSSAIAAGNVDFVLPVSDMPRQIAAYLSGSFVGAPGQELSHEAIEESLRKIFVLLRSRTGHDFSSYKVKTIRRRLERRLNLHSIKEPSQYIRYMQENPHEIDILFKELLISVTSFFRDSEAFESLEKAIQSSLLKSDSASSQFRVWVPGCATGEEAYTLAILLREQMEAAGQSCDVQIFGTDLDSEAIDFARSATYPATISEDVSPERLERFFHLKDGAYTINKNIREMVIFAVQNVIKDPPFTKLDCITCRNLLIYFNSDLQRRLLPVFHYALKPESLLFLGPSETIGNRSDLFEIVDKKWKIFRRKESLGPGRGVAELSLTHARTLNKSGEILPVVRRLVAGPESSLSSMVESLLLDQFAPASVVVNNQGDVVFIHGRTGAYLEPAAGQAHLNVHNMAREGLKLELASAFRHAISNDEDVRRADVRVRSDGGILRTDLLVSPIRKPDCLQGLFLISFSPHPVELESSDENKLYDTEVTSLTTALERELESAKESLNIIIEELETSNEELKSTNEELQSSNEELETSKEEMQSLNEELTTVNTELNLKIEGLSQANNDMQNLLNSIKIATIFLDVKLRIKRYTEETKHLVKFIQADVGRPLEDLASNLNYDQLVADCREVLRTLVFKEAEVSTKNGQWYLMRIMPYRTAGNVIDGLVITFVDIDPVKKAEQELELAKENLSGDLDAMKRLYKIGTLFLSEGVSPLILDEVCDAAICIGSADMGHLQRFDPKSGSFKVMEQRGFKRTWLSAFESEDLLEGAFGATLRKGGRIVISDVASDQMLTNTPVPEILEKAGVCSMVAIPLISQKGDLFGVISIYYKMERVADSRVLRLLDLLARQASQILDQPVG